MHGGDQGSGRAVTKRQAALNLEVNRQQASIAETSNRSTAIGFEGSALLAPKVEDLIQIKYSSTFDETTLCG